MIYIFVLIFIDVNISYVFFSVFLVQTNHYLSYDKNPSEQTFFQITTNKRTKKKRRRRKEII
jgi:hypothetical protein